MCQGHKTDQNDDDEDRNLDDDQDSVTTLAEHISQQRLQFLDLGCQWILPQFRMVQVTKGIRLNDWRLKANSTILRW